MTNFPTTFTSESNLIVGLLALLAMVVAVVIMVNVRVSARARKTQAARLSLQLRQGILRSQVEDRRSDFLTSLATRETFCKFMCNAVADGQPFAVLLVNVDGFASVNASFGYKCGDELLKHLAEKLSLASFTSSWARLGSDEFGTVLRTANSQQEVEEIALGIARSLRDPVCVQDQRIEVRLSLGVGQFPQHGTTSDAVLTAASSALQQCKANGGGGWHFYNPHAELEFVQRAALREEFRKAIALGQVVPFYQPINDLRSGATVGFEVLARWQSLTRGLVYPDVFIPLAEEMNLVGAITELLMTQVLTDARTWPSNLFFSFNVAPGQLRELLSL